MRVLVTGAAGFIGFHIASAFIARGDSVVGLDSLNDYYDPALKQARLSELRSAADHGAGRFSFLKADLADKAALDEAFASEPFDRVVHFAAQAGVRYSLDHPESYVRSNLVGFANLLECCRAAETPHLVFASSSSVYGANAELPFSEHHPAVHPIQLYAATKRSNELMAHSYSHLFGLPITALRLFTVYGPWGRPDMSLFKFTEAILAGQPIELSNRGKHIRDFTHIDDLVAVVTRVVDGIARPDPEWRADAPDPAASNAPFEIFNIASGRPTRLLDYVEALERKIGKTAERRLLERSPADMIDTHADISRIRERFGFAPAVSLEAGIASFVDWYRSFYGQ